MVRTRRDQFGRAQIAPRVATDQWLIAGSARGAVDPCRCELPCGKKAAAVVTYVIEIRNRRLRGDRWQYWGLADGDAHSLRCVRALRAAFGERYEIRRRAVGGES